MTKYARQIVSARKTIIAKGTVCVWAKPGAHVGNDPTPEFPELEDAAQYLDTPIVLYPVKGRSDTTQAYNAKLEAGEISLFGCIPGDVEFMPEENDVVIVSGVLYHCTFVNTTMPDGTPIIHEVGMK